MTQTEFNKIIALARAEHAIRLREQGKTLREIGQRLGVCSQAASNLCYQGLKMRRRDAFIQKWRVTDDHAGT